MILDRSPALRPRNRVGDDERERLAAILKFVERQNVYRGKAVLQIVAGVQTANELEACRQGAIARVRGPAVTTFLDAPLAMAEGTPLVQARDAA